MNLLWLMNPKADRVDLLRLGFRFEWTQPNSWVTAMLCNGSTLSNWPVCSNLRHFASSGSICQRSIQKSYYCSLRPRSHLLQPRAFWQASYTTTAAPVCTALFWRWARESSLLIHFSRGMCKAAPRGWQGRIGCNLCCVSDFARNLAWRGAWFRLQTSRGPWLAWVCTAAPGTVVRARFVAWSVRELGLLGCLSIRSGFSVKFRSWPQI